MADTSCWRKAARSLSVAKSERRTEERRMTHCRASEEEGGCLFVCFVCVGGCGVRGVMGRRIQRITTRACQRINNMYVCTYLRALVEVEEELHRPGVLHHAAPRVGHLCVCVLRETGREGKGRWG